MVRDELFFMGGYNCYCYLMFFIFRWGIEVKWVKWWVIESYVFMSMILLERIFWDIIKKFEIVVDFLGGC